MNLSFSTYRPWLLSAGGALLLLVWRFVGDHYREAVWLQQHLQYEVLVLTTLLAICCGVRIWRAHAVSQILLGRVRECLGVVAAVAVISSLWSIYEPAKLRICQDDSQHMATAMLMHQTGQVGVPNTMLGDGDRCSPMSVGYVYRGVFHAYVVSIAHDLFGYDERRVYQVNFALGVLLLLQCYVLGRVCCRMDSGGWIAMLLMASVSLLAQLARSAGYDLLNTVLLVAFILSLRLAWRRPGRDELVFSAALGALLALARAESIVYFGGYAVVVVLLLWKRRAPDFPFALLLVVPAILSALAVQIILVKNYASVSDSMNTTTKPNWGWSNLVLHGQDAIAYAFAPDLISSASSLLAWLGVMGAVLVIARLALKRLVLSYDIVALLSFGLVSLLFYTVTLGTFWGGPSQPEMTRFSMPMWALLVYAVVVSMHCIDTDDQCDASVALLRPARSAFDAAVRTFYSVVRARLKIFLTTRYPVVALFVVLYLFTLNAVRVHRGTEAMEAARVYNAISALGDTTVREKGIFHVVNSSLIFAAKRASCATSLAVEHNPERLALAKRYGMIKKVYLYYAKSQDSGVDRVLGTIFYRANLADWKVKPVASLPIEGFPRGEAVCFEVLAVKNKKGTWISFDEAPLNLPEFMTALDYARLRINLMP